MKLSFILPVYKPVRKVFERCIKSLVSQSLKDIELIFVLDGPSSEARAIINYCLSKQDIPWNVVEIEHGGACKARNEGFKYSKGEYVVFWDADCYVEPDAAKAWVEILDRDKEIGFVYASYKFSDEKGAIHAEPFDPWLLRVRNYISTCFPLRRELFPGWNESLKSLQDWDFWLSVVEKGGKGKFLQGYAFTTEYPTPKSISGEGCLPDVWLERVDAVKKAHNLPDRSVCVSSLQYKSDGILLAKLIDADYQDFPNFKPHRYKTIIQIGFSMLPNAVEKHAAIFGDKDVKKVLFWTGDNISEIYNAVSFSAIQKYALLLNKTVKQYVEDRTAKEMMEKAGFEVDILPLPIQDSDEPEPLPAEPCFAVDICGEYGHIFTALEKSVPDVKLEMLTGHHPIGKYTGLLHFYLDRSMSNSIKRAVLSNRQVISNVKAPFAGFVDDLTPPEKFLPAMVEKIREAAYGKPTEGAREYYMRQYAPQKLLEAIQ